MADNYSEIHNRMSKKIAQLTKVIYHLHTKNEENKSYVQALSKAHDKEIESILKDANRIVGKYKTALDKQQKQGDVKAMVRELEERHEKEKLDSQAQFRDYKQQVADNERQLTLQYKDKVEGLKAEVVEARAAFEARLDELKKQMQKQMNNSEALDELKMKHAKEMAEHVRESNQKYNQLYQDKLDLEDRLKAQFDKDK